MRIANIFISIACLHLMLMAADVKDSIKVDSVDVAKKDTVLYVKEVKSDSLQKDTVVKITKSEDSLQKTITITVKKENDDTIDASIVAKKLSKIKSSFSSSMSKSRIQGYGGGLMISPMIAAVSMKPINELAHHDYTLRKYYFPDLDDDFQPILFMGGTVYGGLGNGVRIGVGGWSGEYKFTSDISKDSALYLNVDQSFGGFLVEKAFVKNTMNYLVGGMIGGGSLKVTRGYSNNPWKSIRDLENYDEEQAKAIFSGVNIHGGFTASVLPWMHIGADINSTFLFSVNGFDIPGCNGFASAVPGLRFRIVFGNIG